MSGTDQAEVWVIVVAGGSGARFGAEKQYVVLRDRPVLAWSVAVGRTACIPVGRAGADGVPPVSGEPAGPGRADPPEGDQERAAESVEGGVDVRGIGRVTGEHSGDSKGAAMGSGGVVAVVPAHRVGDGSFGADVVVAGGSSRSASVRAGLAAVPPSASVIVVHDAARPLATPALLAAVIGAVLDGADAAVPGLEVTDTIRHRAGGTLDRSGLVRVQTPQAFRAEALRAAHRHPAEATDDATLVEQCGGSVVVVPGEPTNIKLTDPTDLAVAETLLQLMSRNGPGPVDAPSERSRVGGSFAAGSLAGGPTVDGFFGDGVANRGPGR
ncbi:MAG: 2-C-methyl-D-erythritol 4-phosphate cytidylyltransferase [Acidimicrobiales bacterium]